MNDNPTSTNNLSSQTRPFTQSVRGNPSVVPQQLSATGTLKPAKPQTENRKGKLIEIYSTNSHISHFS